MALNKVEIHTLRQQLVGRGLPVGAVLEVAPEDHVLEPVVLQRVLQRIGRRGRAVAVQEYRGQRLARGVDERPALQR